MAEHHAGSGPENGDPVEWGGSKQANYERQQQHKHAGLPIGVEDMAQSIEPDNFLLGVLVGLIRIVANRDVGVSVANDRSIGQPVCVPKHHAVDERKHVQHQQKAGNKQAIWRIG